MWERTLGLGKALGSVPCTWGWVYGGGVESRKNFMFRVIASLVAEVWPQGFLNKVYQAKVYSGI